MDVETQNFSNIKEIPPPSRQFYGQKIAVKKESTGGCCLAHAPFEVCTYRNNLRCGQRNKIGMSSISTCVDVVLCEEVTRDIDWTHLNQQSDT